MYKRKTKQLLKCKVCGKGLRGHNKSGLCGLHFRVNYNRKDRLKRKINHICLTCGKKVEPKIVYPAGKLVPPIITYPIRCYTCRKKYSKKTNVLPLKSD